MVSTTVLDCPNEPSKNPNYPTQEKKRNPGISASAAPRYQRSVARPMARLLLSVLTAATAACTVQAQSYEILRTDCNGQVSFMVRRVKYM